MGIEMRDSNESVFFLVILVILVSQVILVNLVFLVNLVILVNLKIELEFWKQNLQFL